MKHRRLAPFRPQLEQLESRLTMSGPGASNPVILSPDQEQYGHTYGEWSARFWQWAYSLPVDHHPLYDTTGADVSRGQSGPVWFLGASFVSTTDPATGITLASATRNVKVPDNVAFFIPIINAEASTIEGNGTNKKELSAVAKSFQDPATNMSFTLDNKTVFSQQRTPYNGEFRVQSPLYTFGPLPADNVLLLPGGAAGPAGATSKSVADGVYQMVAPLSDGSHTIHFHGELPNFQFVVDITYILNVVHPDRNDFDHGHDNSHECLQATFVVGANSSSQQNASAVISNAARSDQPTSLPAVTVAPEAVQFGVNSQPGPAARRLKNATEALDDVFAGLWND